MKAYIIQTIKQVKQTNGEEITCKAYVPADQVEQFYGALGNDRSVVDSKTVLYRPTNVQHWKNVV